MPQITVNLIHDLKKAHEHKEKVPFIGGLRTGFVHAWFVTAVKVMFIFALLSGVDIVGKLQENVVLLDQLVGNDFTVNSEDSLPKRIVIRDNNFMPRGESFGVVASEFSDNSSMQTNGVVASENTVVVNNIQNAPVSGSGITQSYIDELIRYNIANAIAARFLLPGTGDNSDGCLQIDRAGTVTTRGSRCGSGGGGGGGSSPANLSIGSIISGATPNSILFVGAGGELAQDAANLFWDDANNSLVIDGEMLVTSLATGGATECVQANILGVLSTTGAPCGAGGGGMSIGGSITSATTGSVLFAGAAGVLQQDNANFFWDDTNNRLGIGTASPIAPLHVGGSNNFGSVSLFGYSGAVNTYINPVYSTDTGTDQVTANTALLELTNSSQADMVSFSGQTGVVINSSSADMASTYSQMIGGAFYSGLYGTGSIYGATGVMGIVMRANSGTVESAQGGYFAFQNANGTGTTSSVIGVNIGQPVSPAGHTITSTFGLYIADQTNIGGGTQTNTPYGIYQAGASNLNYFGGTITAPGAGASSERFGFGSSADGASATALGWLSSASGDGDLAVGGGAESSGGYSIAIGYGAQSTGVQGISLGFTASASGNASVALGNFASASSVMGHAFGYSATSSALGGLAIGQAATVNGTAGIALGGGTAAGAHELVIGGEYDTFNSIDYGINNVYIGNGVTNATPQSFALNATGGQGANIAGANIAIAGGKGTGSAVGGNILFQYAPAGSSGSSLNSLQTACAISGTNGSLNCPGTGAFSARFGSGATAGGLGANAFGTNANAGGLSAAAYGGNAYAPSDYATALGSLASSLGPNSVAAGALATAYDNGSAFGAYAFANNNSIALGYSAATSAANQLVIGSGSASIQTAYIGNGVTNATPQGFSLNATGGSGTNIAGANMTLASGRATGNAAGGNILFQTSDVGSSGSTLQTLTTKATLLANGNFGIGTAAPALKFSVEADAASSYVASFQNTGNNANRYGIQIQAGADDGSGTTYYLNALDGDGTQVGYISRTGGTFALTDVSDFRTKTNIQNSEVDAMEVLTGLRVVDFNRLADPNGAVITGFIAQEVQSVYPQIVTTGENGMLGITKENLIPVLVKGFQQQQNQINSLLNQVNSLQGNSQGNLSGNTPIVLAHHLYLSEDTVGQAEILAGEKSVRITFTQNYEYQPIVTVTPQSRVGGEYWVSDKGATGFTIHIEDGASDNILFDWHAFATKSIPLLTVESAPITPSLSSPIDEDGVVATEEQVDDSSNSNDPVN